jgi:iron complex transport system substrate-binding protein
MNPGVKGRQRATAMAVVLLTVGAWAHVGPRAAQPPGRDEPAPRRIVSLIPAVTEMLIALGAGRELAGVSSFDMLPHEYDSVARVGGLIDPDTERILSLRPDLVVFYDTQTELRDQLARAAIPTFSYEHGGLADITATIRQLAVRIGRHAEGERLAADIERRIEEVRQRVAGKPRPRTLLVFGRDPGSLRNIDASGGLGFLHDMLIVAGGRNVFADTRRQLVRATAELIITRAPEVIIELQSDAERPPVGKSATAEAWNALSSVPAVRAHRIHVVDGNRIGRPGPDVVASILTLARLLHPDVFRLRD